MSSQFMKSLELKPGHVRQVQDPASIPFETSHEAQSFEGFLGQSRAQSAMCMGLDVNVPGYNLFVSGQTGTGRRTLIATVLSEAAALKPTPADLVLVPDFDNPDAPMILAVADGRGRSFCRELRAALALLSDCLCRALEDMTPPDARTGLAEGLIRREVDDALAPLFEAYDNGALHGFLNAMAEDLVENRALRKQPQGIVTDPRYVVDLLVDHSAEPAAPIVFEDHPTAVNLVGTVIEPKSGGMRVRPGALHRANGGFLILDAGRVLKEAGAWAALKRCLLSGSIHMGGAEALPLQPAAVQLDVKLVLYGSRSVWQNLCHQESELDALVKVEVDFEDSLERNPDNVAAYARLLATLTSRETTRAMGRAGVARLIEEAARLAGDAHKLSLRLGVMLDLIRESDYQAARAGVELIGVAEIEAALALRRYHSGRYYSRLHERVERGSLLIRTDGRQVGVINGLTVVRVGKGTFGQVSRITATARCGDGKVIDIERETKLGGTSHTKGVMILSNLLAARYSKDQPLSLTASVVFEQSHARVNGDSASLAEFCVLISALAEVPIRQYLALTGAVDQHGKVLPIGSVNHKIEGFFDLCRATGLTGNQGVLIPAANVKSLMPRPDVAQAVAEGRFHVYAVDHVDQALQLLTGRKTGPRGVRGGFPAGSLNRIVHDRLLDFTRSRKMPASKMPVTKHKKK